MYPHMSTSKFAKFAEQILFRQQNIDRRIFPKSLITARARVAHTCNPSYSGGRDQEDHGWKPTLGK
jgi:hypothetical protein